MKYQIGDRFLCIRTSTGIDMNPNLEEGKIYFIDDIRNVGSGYYSISNYLYYSKDDMNNYIKNVTNNIKSAEVGGGMQGSVGAQGILPSFKICDYFKSVKEERKQKLDQIEKQAK